MNLLTCLHLLYYFVIILVAANASRRKGQLLEAEDTANWTGKWFPTNPFHKIENLKHENFVDPASCDDGVHGIEIDFSPNKKEHNFNYLCVTNNLTLFLPNVQTQTVMTEFYIPPVYEPYSVCNNTPLIYDEKIPTFGAFRLLPPKYGEYKYLPPQRWVRSLAEGAIVMLYHPCAERTQRKLLENLVKACLYRHVITPSYHLSSEHPMALLVWGKLLKLSVVDKHIVVNFIKSNAKKGPYGSSVGNEVQATEYYEQALLQESRLVTDQQDSEVCAFDIQDM